MLWAWLAAGAIHGRALLEPTEVLPNASMIQHHITAVFLCRLAEAKLGTEGRAAALQELAPLFSKPPKQLFCINITQVTATEAPEAAPAGRKRRKGARSGRAHHGDQSPKAEQGERLSWHAARLGGKDKVWGKATCVGKWRTTCEQTKPALCSCLVALSYALSILLQ